MALADLIKKHSSTSLEGAAYTSDQDIVAVAPDTTIEEETEQTRNGPGSAAPSSEDGISRSLLESATAVAPASSLDYVSSPPVAVEGHSSEDDTAKDGAGTCGDQGIESHVKQGRESVPPQESQMPKGVAEVVTPSGIQIFFQAAPKRLYKVNGHEVPSVTAVLDVLEKGGLSWWGMKVGVEGLQQVATWMMHDEPMSWDRVLFTMTPDEVVDLLTKNKLTVNHVRDQAGYRGQAVHDALEDWAEKNLWPHPLVYASEERGYVQGLLDFLIESGAEALASEVMVGSKKHKYAGRFDLRAFIPDNVDVVVKTYPKKKPLYGKLQGGEWLLDLKTSKGIYDTHFMQLEAYEEASKECGYEPTVQRGVIHVTEDGRYELVQSKATFKDFKAVLGAYRALERLKAR